MSTREPSTDFIQRGDRTARAGVVRWPDHLVMGDMGTAVYAVVPERITANGEVGGVVQLGADPFVRCLDATPFVMGPAECASPGFKELFRGEVNESDPASWHSDPVLAAVCLGTCGGGFYDDGKGGTWQCTVDDLEPAGRALVDALAALYGRPVLLFTLVDT